MGVFVNKQVEMASPSIQSAHKGLVYYLKRLGVSVAFSGAAVGVSHVVQATRAGADFSLGLLPIIVGCLVLKYPAFLFGPLYTQVSGESVVHGYARIGKWTLPIVALTFLSTMFSVVAAVSLLAASLMIAAFGIQVDVTVLAMGLAVFSTLLSLFTSFSQFQESMKIAFILLVVMCFTVLIFAIPKLTHTPIVAPGDGVVIFTGRKSGFGNFIMIAHGYGIISRYGHIAQSLVSPGQKVTRGQQIATVGMTGRTTGPHLHYEILANGSAINPRKFILDDDIYL